MERCFNFIFTDGGSSAWSNVMTNVSGAIYKTVVPSGTFDKMIAVRMDPLNQKMIGIQNGIKLMT